MNVAKDSAAFKSIPPPSVKPVDGNERRGIVADHSVVRCRRSAVEDAYPAEQSAFPRLTALWIAISVGPRRGPRLSRVRLRTRRPASSRLMPTNAAALSRTTPWSAAGVPQSKTPTPQNKVHSRG
jgi:hypothetical protein